MMFGIARCGVYSATFSAISDMPLVSAMVLKGGADGFVEPPPLLVL